MVQLLRTPGRKKAEVSSNAGLRGKPCVCHVMMCNSDPADVIEAYVAACGESWPCTFFYLETILCEKV